MTEESFEKFADQAEGTWSEPVAIAIGISNAYRDALEKKQNLDSQKITLFRLIKKEINRTANDDDQDVHEIKQRISGARKADRNSGDSLWYEDFGPDDSELREGLGSRYPDYFGESGDGGSRGNGAGDSDKQWWKHSEFTRIGRKVKRVQMESEYFAEKLIRWVFYDGKSPKNYKSAVFDHIKSTPDDELPTHPCRFQRAFAKLGFSKQVAALDIITERIHETQAGCEFMQIALDCERASGPSNYMDWNYEDDWGPEAGLWQGVWGPYNAKDKKVMETLHVPPNSTGYSRKKERALDYIRMMENSGLNLILLFDHDLNNPSELVKHRLAWGYPKHDKYATVISPPDPSNPTFNNGKVTGKGDSEALGRIAKRMMAGVTMEMGDIVDPETRANVDLAKETASRPLGALVDSYFSREFHEGILGLTQSQLTDMKDGNISSVITGNYEDEVKKRRKDGINPDSDDSSENTVKQYFDSGQQFLGYVQSITDGISEFNDMVTKTREYAEESDEVSDVVKKMSNETGNINVNSGTKAVASIVQHEEWWDSFDDKVVVMSSVMTTFSTISTLGELVIGDSEWRFRDSLGVIQQVQSIHETVTDINGMRYQRALDEFANGGTRFSRVVTREEIETADISEFANTKEGKEVLIPKAVGESIGIVTDVLDMGQCAYRAGELSGVGDTDAAIAKRVEGAFTGIGLAVSIFGSGPIAGIVVAVATITSIAASLIATWLTDRPILNWIETSAFGNGEPGETEDPIAEQFKIRDQRGSHNIARQISWYLSIRLSFTIEMESGYIFGPAIRLDKSTSNSSGNATMEIILENVLRGSKDSDLIVCPIKETGGIYYIQRPSHVIPLGDDDTYDFYHPMSELAIHRNKEYMLREVEITDRKRYNPQWWDDANNQVKDDPAPPSEIWAWDGRFKASDVAHFFAAGNDKYGGQVPLNQEDNAYSSTWGAEIIHAIGGLDDDLRTVLQEAEKADAEKQKKLAKLTEKLPHPRQRAPKRWSW